MNLTPLPSTPQASRQQNASSSYTPLTRHVGITSGHSTHAAAQHAADSNREHDPTAVKAAFAPSQGFNLHTTTYNPFMNPKTISYHEAAAAAEAAGNRPLAGHTKRVYPVKEDEVLRSVRPFQQRERVQEQYALAVQRLRRRRAR